MTDILDTADEKSEPLELQVWIDLILYPRKMTLYMAEQKGFVRLLRGYRATGDMLETVCARTGSF